MLLAAQAETLFAVDPVASVTKLQLFGELLAQEAAAHLGLYTSREESQSDLVRRLRERGGLRAHPASSAEPADEAEEERAERTGEEARAARVRGARRTREGLSLLQPRWAMSYLRGR